MCRYRETDAYRRAVVVAMQRIPFFRPLTDSPAVRKELLADFEALLVHGGYVRGPEVTCFEKQLSSRMGGAVTVSVGNGTDALLAAFMALGLKRGDEVIVPSFTYPAATEMLLLLGITPVLVDVCEDTFNLDPGLLTDALSEKTRAIVPVHLFGLCAEMEPILAFARKHDLFVVEDAAQSLGAVYAFSDGTRQQAALMGDVGCTSFFPTKNLGGLGDGGAVFARDAGLAAKVRSLVNHGQGGRRHEHEQTGFNSRLDTVQAIALLRFLPDLEKHLACRRTLAGRYECGLCDCDGLVLPEMAPGHTFNQYAVRVLDNRRDELGACLAENGIDTMVYYPLGNHQQKAYTSRIRKGSAMPCTENLTRSLISLPIFPGLAEREQDRIIRTIRKFFSGK